MRKQSQDEADIIEALTKLQEQLAALDRKVDYLINKPLPQLVDVKPFIQPAALQQPTETRPVVEPVSAQSAVAQAQEGGRPNDRRQPRPTYRAVCAECQKECDLPFKPGGDRPVYCKECFSRRRSAGNAAKVVVENKPPEETPSLPEVVHAAVDIPETPSKDRKATAAAKRPAAKRKPVSAKKK